MTLATLLEPAAPEHTLATPGITTADAGRDDDIDEDEAYFEGDDEGDEDDDLEESFDEFEDEEDYDEEEELDDDDDL